MEDFMLSLKKIVFAVTTIICLASSTFARVNSKDYLPGNSEMEAKQAVRQYYQNLVLLTANKTRSISLFDVAQPPDQYCHERKSCVDVACQYGQNCQYGSHLNEIITLCRGTDGNCVDGACKYGQNCQYSSHLNDIITACHDSNGECVQAACQYGQNCQYSSHLDDIMRLCKGADGDCVRSACKYSNNCQYSSHLEDTIKSCGGQK
jgi:hypothetical protein